MNIQLNNQSSSNILLLDGVENIVTFNESVTGEKAQIMLVFSNNLAATVTGDGQYYITLLDETITSVVAYKNAINKTFWISTSPTDTASSVAQALRSCASIMAEWDITHDGVYIYLTAKRIGPKLQNYAYWQRTNIGGSYLSIAERNYGSATSTLLDGKCNIELTQGETLVARLSKQMYDAQTDFNISPALADYTNYGEVSIFTLTPSTVDVDGSFTQYSQMTIRATKGYECNGSDPYLTNATRILWNKRHNGLDNINYLYHNKIDLSVLNNATVSTWLYTYLYDSAHNQIYSARTSVSANQPFTLQDFSLSLPEAYFAQAFYAKVELSSYDSIEFQIIKPLNATEYFQRIYWRNEYGGIQFFDFTAQKAESYEIQRETYNVNTFDRYRTPNLPKEKIYDIQTDKTYTLTSHLMQKNGKYAMDSLSLAKEVWTELGNNTYHIIPTAISVSEQDNYNNIFTAQLSYRIA